MSKTEILEKLDDGLDVLQMADVAFRDRKATQEERELVMRAIRKAQGDLHRLAKAWLPEMM